MSIRIGDTVGDYRVIGICGAGAVGQVFKVEHVVTKRVEAMKVLSQWTPKDSPAGQRFLREIQVQARLNHPNIAAVHNAFWWNDHLVMVMEYVEGESLAALLEAGPLDTSTALDYMDQALAGLAYAHEHDVVHRDFKPANVLITAEGKVKLTDFGLAKTLRTASITESGDFVGTLYYTAPEQVKSEPGQDARADLYSVGVVLFEAAAGRRPFNSEQFYELMVAHATKPPPRPSESNASLPGAFDDVVLRALEKNPAHRFQTAGEFRKALAEVRHAIREKTAVPAAAPARERRAATRRPRRRLPIEAITASVAVAGLLAGIVWQARQPAARTVTLEVPQPLGPAEEVPVDPSSNDPAGSLPETSTGAPVPPEGNRPPPKRSPRPAGKSELLEPTSPPHGGTIAPPEQSKPAAGGGRMLHTLQPGGAAWVVALSPDGKLVAAGTGDGDVGVWNAASGERVAAFEGHRKRVAGLSFSPDGKMLASASWDGSARIWNLGPNQPDAILEVGNDLTAVAFGPGGRRIAVGARDKSIRIWDVASHTETQKLRGQDREPQALAFSPDGRMLASGAAENVVRVWRLDDDGKPRKLNGPGTGINALAFSPDGRSLAGAGADRVRVWDVAEGSEIRTENSPGWLHALTPSPGGRFLSLGAVADSLELKTVGDASSPGPLPGGIKARSVALSADGKRAAAAGGDGTVTVWDTGR